jgi:CcmD family protein
MIDTYPALFWGYAVMWLLIVLYTLSLGRRMAKVEERLRSRKE